MLRPFNVVNPYAEELFYEDDRLQARRDQPKFLNLCNAIAFINQFKKEVKHYLNSPYIEVDKEDISRALYLASEFLGVSLDDLSLPARNLLDMLVEMNQKIFTRKEVLAFTGWSKTRLHIHLHELIDLELVVKESGKRNCLQHYKLLYTGESQKNNKTLIGLINH